MARVYWMEAKTEFLKLVRTKVYSLSTLLFPLMFYIFCGLAMGQQQGNKSLDAARYLLATYGAFTIVSATLYALGVGVAVEHIGVPLPRRPVPPARPQVVVPRYPTTSG